MHSWNKTKNTFYVWYLVTCCSVGQLVGVSPQNWVGCNGFEWLVYWKDFKQEMSPWTLVGLEPATVREYDYTPLLVLSCWQLVHRDCILNCLEHYNYFEPIFGSLIFRVISVRWIGMQILPYLHHFCTHLWKTTLFYTFSLLFTKLKLVWEVERFNSASHYAYSF